MFPHLKLQHLIGSVVSLAQLESPSVALPTQLVLHLLWASLCLECTWFLVLGHLKIEFWLHFIHTDWVFEGFQVLTPFLWYLEYSSVLKNRLLIIFKLEYILHLPSSLPPYYYEHQRTRDQSSQVTSYFLKSRITLLLLQSRVLLLSHWSTWWGLWLANR